MNKHVFGPVHSRRLGKSLGIDIIPQKVCSLNCIYCELGRTDRLTLTRKPYVRAVDVLAELDTMMGKMQELDHLTFSGSGEPTLNSEIGEMIRGIHLISSVPVAVITNGTTLIDPEVRRDLRSAHVVLPSLDAATECAFHRIDRPHGRVRLTDVIEGIRRFRDEFPGQLWLEVLLVKGINDTPEEIDALRNAISLIKPDRVHLNTVLRPPAEEDVHGLTDAEMENVQSELGSDCEIPVDRHGHYAADSEMRNAIARCVEKKSMTLSEIAIALDDHRDALVHYITEMVKQGILIEHWENGEHFYQSSGDVTHAEN